MSRTLDEVREDVLSCDLFGRDYDTAGFVDSKPVVTEETPAMPIHPKLADLLGIEL